MPFPSLHRPIHLHRLRQIDVKAEHYERQVARIEQERDAWENKFEEAQGKYLASKKELEELAAQVRVVSPALIGVTSPGALFLPFPLFPPLGADDLTLSVERRRFFGLSSFLHSTSTMCSLDQWTR